MHSMSVTKEIDAPAETVWEVLDDFGNLQAYSPKNVDCTLLDGPETGVGARRETTLEDGSQVVHEITEYEPMERYRFEFSDMGDYPMNELYIEFSLEAVDDDQTHVTMRADFIPKWGPLGWVLAKTIMKRKNRHILEETLDGLDRHVRTGETIGKTKGSVDSPTE